MNRFVKSQLDKLERNNGGIGLEKNIGSTKRNPIKIVDTLQGLSCRSLQYGFLKVNDFGYYRVRGKLIQEYMEKVIEKTLINHCKMIMDKIHASQEKIVKLNRIDEILNKSKKGNFNKPKSIHLDFCINSMKRVISSISFRVKYSVLILLKSLAALKPQRYSNHHTKLIFYILSNTYNREISYSFNHIFSYSLTKKNNISKIKSLITIFQRKLQIILTTIKKFNTTPKYFLSTKWRYNGLNIHCNFAKRNWKNMAISRLFLIIGKRISNVKCYGYYRLMSHISISCSTSISSPIKNTVCSTDNSFINLSYSCSPSKKTINLDKTQLSILKLIFISQKKHKLIYKYCFLKFSKFGRSSKAVLNRTPCRYLPMCRKIRQSYIEATDLSINQKNRSPINITPKRK